MALLRKINQVLLFLLIVTLCGILYKKVHKGTVLRNETGMLSETSWAPKDKYTVRFLLPRFGRLALCPSLEAPNNAAYAHHLLSLLPTGSFPLRHQWPQNPQLRKDPALTLCPLPAVLRTPISLLRGYTHFICNFRKRPQINSEAIGKLRQKVGGVYARGVFCLFLFVCCHLFRKWIEHSKLREINFKIVEFNPIVLKGKVRPDSSRPELLQPLNFVRFYLPLLIHQHEKVIYLDDDVIVQGDIQELYDTTLALGHAAAFSDDCDLPSAQDMNRFVGLQNTYMGYLDYRKKTIKDLGISPSTCSFNPGVIVANMTEWKHQRITKQLEKWMQKNVEENLYSSSLGGGVATSPMLIVFHGKYSTINPLWHIRHLGWNPDTRYSEHFLQEAKLLHWNGRHKPWDFPSVHNDLWESWFVPDPAGIFKLNHHSS
uniref:glycosyltransferase 8 domain-containing protein 2 n=1 Tax=Panthera onca TaxID=9690 RepID=UPI002955B339|nr:glycosyltransferase 8 domain-containing protein 2 [Panthera onca]